MSGFSERVLLTGSLGFLGSSIAERLPHVSGVRPILTARRGQGDGVLPMNLHSSSEIHRIFREFKPHVLIHTAAFTDVDGAESDKKRSWVENVEAVRILIEACSPIQTFFLHLSTDFVFDGLGNKPYGEKDPTHPINYYGYCKRKSEELLQQQRRFSYAVLRSCHIYGKREGSVLSPRWNIFSLSLKHLREKTICGLVTDTKNNPVWVEDVTTLCLRVIERRLHGIIHVGGERALSPYDFGRSLANYMGQGSEGIFYPISQKTLNRQALRPSQTELSVLRAKDELNYQPTPLEKVFSSLLA
ncbi:MAG: SDR family oxidoreductase [Cytophagales bacterium]|nr:SDR family oxidoreductase [Cytophagales bacterium]